MNELVITPNFEKKSAKICGRCAAGEHVLVRLVGMAGLPAETLRLCIMLRERLFAVFPLAIEDSAAEWTVDGSDLTCVLNLNTEPLVKFARCGALTLEFILDDPSNHILYFSEMHQVQPWHSLRASGDDTQPRDTPPFDGVVISTKTLGDLREAVRRLAEKGGAKIISSVAVALLAVCGAFAATVQTVPLNDLDYDVNPPVVTNVTFEGLADATNVYTKAETEEKIVELAPAPGNYAAVSNAAMSAKTKLSAIFNMDNPTAVPKAVEAQESESASFASEANKAYNLFAEGEEPESRSSIDIFAAIDAALRKDKQNNEVQTFGGTLSGFGFHADTGHNDNGWNQYTAHNGTALAQPLPAYILSNPWGFLKQGEAIPTTGGVFNAYIHLNQKFSVGTWTQYVKPIESVGGSGIAFAFGDNVQTKASNTMVLGVGALNTNNWSFVWNGDANRMYVPTQPNISNPYPSRYNGGFHVNPSVRTGMTNPLQNFWIGDTNLATWISIMETDPTVPQWAKAAQKPSYTASEVGAYSTNETMYVDWIGDIGCIYGDYMPSGVWDFGDGCLRLANWYQFNVHMTAGRQSDGIEIFDTADPTIKTVIPINGSDVATIADIPASVSNIVTAAYINDRVNVTPLAGRTYDFATNIGLYTAVRDIIQALGGSVTNFPAIPQN